MGKILDFVRDHFSGGVGKEKEKKLEWQWTHAYKINF